MGLRKRVPSEFGVIVPRDNGVTWIKQGGGMSCIQRELTGLYLPIGKMKYNLGLPDWTPEGPEFEEKLREIDIWSLPKEEIKRIPEYIRERGHFASTEEFFYWVEQSEVYGWIHIWDDLRRFTYGMFDLLESDPRDRWEDVDELWDALEDSFSFTYEEVERGELMELPDDVYPNLNEAAIHPIRLTGSKSDDKGRVHSQWADQLEGTIVYLMCPNAD